MNGIFHYGLPAWIYAKHSIEFSTNLYFKHSSFKKFQKVRHTPASSSSLRVEYLRERPQLVPPLLRTPGPRRSSADACCAAQMCSELFRLHTDAPAAPGAGVAAGTEQRLFALTWTLFLHTRAQGARAPRSLRPAPSAPACAC